MGAKIEYHLSSGKNKYLIVGDNNPEEMLLPIVFDIRDLSEIFNKLIQEILPGKKLNFVHGTGKKPHIKLIMEEDKDADL